MRGRGAGEALSCEVCVRRTSCAQEKRISVLSKKVTEIYAVVKPAIVECAAGGPTQHNGIVITRIRAPRVTRADHRFHRGSRVNHVIYGFRPGIMQAQSQSRY